MASVLSVLLEYDFDKMVSVSGFGAKPNKDKVSHCFNLSQLLGNPQENVQGIQNVFDLYAKSIEKMEFHGPTFFEPILLKTFNDFKAQVKLNPKHYSVLLILTDGVIHDMDETIELLAQNSKNCGVSIIIVGIGKEDFTIMKQLDGDNKALVSESGKKVERDLIQFVEWSKFES
jgi:Copine